MNLEDLTTSSPIWEHLSASQQSHVQARQALGGDPSHDAVATKLDVSLRTAVGEAGELVKVGLFIVESRGAKGGRRAPNHYTLADLNNAEVLAAVKAKLKEMNLGKHAKANAQSCKRANEQTRKSQSASTDCAFASEIARLPEHCPDKSVTTNSGCILEAAGAIFQNDSRLVDKKPTCCAQLPIILPTASLPSNHSGHLSKLNIAHDPLGGSAQSPDRSNSELTSGVDDPPYDFTTFQPRDPDDVTSIDHDELQWMIEHYGESSPFRIMAIDPGMHCSGVVVFDLLPGSAPVFIECHALHGCELDDVPADIRAEHMASKVKDCIDRCQPDLIIAEQPYHNPTHKRFASLWLAYVAIRGVVDASGLPCHAVDAANATGKQLIKVPNLKLFHAVTGGVASHHIADAFGLAWRYIMGANAVAPALVSAAAGRNLWPPTPATDAKSLLKSDTAGASWK